MLASKSIATDDMPPTHDPLAAAEPPYSPPRTQIVEASSDEALV